MKIKAFRALLSSAGILVAATSTAQAVENQELAKKLTNPIASVISVPFQFNYDDNLGPEDDGHRYTLNIQPVVPSSLNEDWNVTSRTILPVIHQDDIAPNSGSQTGIGDITESLFFWPAQPTAGGVIWGIGPVFLLPTASDDLLGSDKWGLGPTAVGLKFAGPWTYGALTNHIWSIAGADGRRDLSNTFLQPFVSYTTADAWTYSLNSESTYAWQAEEWSVPLNAAVSKITKLGVLPVSLQGGVRYWAASSEIGPEGWGVRLVITFIFPR